MSASNASSPVEVPPDPERSRPAGRPVAGAAAPDRTGAHARPAARPRDALPATQAGVAAWLDWQCRMIAGVRRGAVWLCPGDTGAPSQTAAVWPAGGEATRMLGALARKAAASGRGLLHKALDEQDPRGEVCDFVAYPLALDGHVVAVAVLAIEIRSEPQRQAVLQLLEWGSAWLETTLTDGAAGRQAAAEIAQAAMTPLTADAPLAVAANRMCSLLADRLGCTRVALGLARGMQVRLAAVSHQVNFDHRLSGIHRLQAAMEECVDQDRAIALPDPAGAGSGLTHAHARMLEKPGIGGLCSVPLRVDAQVVGALICVWEGEAPSRAAIRLVNGLAPRLAPVVELKRREARGAGRRLLDGAGRGLRRLFGYGFVRTKLATAALLLAAAVLGLVQTDLRITARALTEGRVQRAVVAPIDGYLASARVRAGDRVEAGQLIAALDDRELLLARDKLVSERDRHAREYQEALALRERARISVAAARVAQAEAELALVDGQLERIRLHAPFDGTVVSGDLSRALGAPVERGQLLFELVPDAGYRVGLHVDEHDLAGVEPGRRGQLRLAGLPDTAMPVRVTRVVPVATAEPGANLFRAEAELLEVPAGLRPGMQGVASIVVGRGSLLTAWTRELRARLRLWAWSVGL